jgi:hypothetical protein
MTRSRLTPIREIRIGPDGAWWYSNPSDDVPVRPPARVMAALRIAEAGLWFAVKAVVVIIAVPLILLFAAGIFAGLFTHFSW